eukprot:gene3113-11275_t
MRYSQVPARRVCPTCIDDGFGLRRLRAHGGAFCGIRRCTWAPPDGARDPDAAAVEHLLTEHADAALTYTSGEQRRWAAAR